MLNRLSLNRIGLNRIDLNRIGKSSGGSSDRPYIDPKVLDSLCGVWIMDQNTNESESRNIIKNKIADRGGDLELLNFGYKLNSGFGKYSADFESFDWTVGISQKQHNKATISLNGRLCNHAAIEVDEMKVNIIGNVTELIYWYIANPDDTARSEIRLTSGINTLPKSYAKDDGQTYNIGFAYISGDSEITIEQLPLYDGALVTDGKDDMIVSQNTVQEMLGGSNEVTVVSMVHQIGLSSLTTINNIRSESVAHVVCRNVCSSAGKTGVYGYSKRINTNNPPTLINNILGDKKDYTAEGNTSLDPTDKFFVQGYKYNGTISEVSPIAYYWTFIANKVLTTDQINQVITYFNLDKHVKPDIIYDTIRQGITNENHASFNDELVDFSGNGHNMKIYNSAWNKESGINDEGAWQADGVTDYGQYIGDLGLQDYTIAVDRAYVEAKPSQVSIMSNVVDGSINTPFLMEHMGINKILAPHSFGKYTVLSELNINRFISYQSTYKYNGIDITKGTFTNTGSGLTIGRIGGVASQYANIALWSLLLFPYSLSEFLLERQLKRYKLGTLYPDMVEFRPVISGNIPYNDIEISQGSTTLYNKSINKTGIYLQEGSTVRVYIQPSGIDEVSKITVNGVEYTDLPINRNGFYYADFPITKSPQKISYVIDEYIRYEDIVQPYPYIVKLRLGGHIYTYGDKLKVGETVQGMGWTNILDGLYEARTIWYNGINWGVLITLVVAKQMVFTSDKRWLLDTSEPHAIYSPQKLNIPNSSLKILGYVPDLTGKGNHGKLNNFAYTEDSGVAADGSIKFDGTDDHITISNIIGGKCIMAKVTVNRNSGIIYDQRRANVPNKSWMQLNPSSVIFEQNAVSTYIDGILNHNVTGSDLVSKTVNLTCELEIGDTSGTYQPTIGSSYAVGYTTDINLYEFMLFPEIPSEDEIKKLNNVMGIEGGYVESPDYYWDAYGKSNSDADRATIIDQVSKEAANALTANNFAFNEESGYVNNSLVCDGVDDNLKNTNMPVLTDYTWIMKREILGINFCPVAYKGDGSTYLGGSMWFEQGGGGCGSCSFGSTFVGGLTFP